MAYSEKQRTEIVNTICKEIEEGRSLRSVLKDKGMPDSHTFFDWIDNDQKKLLQYARAMELRSDYFADEIIEISDTQNADGYLEPETGRVVIDGQAIQRSKLMVDTRKWLMARMAPKKYGDKSTTVLEGGEKDINISFNEAGN